jgi:hypothetical protein
VLGALVVRHVLDEVGRSGRLYGTLREQARRAAARTTVVGMRDEDLEAEELIAERQAANRRHTPGREPTGARHTRRLIGVTIGILIAVTTVLVVVLALGS